MDLHKWLGFYKVPPLSEVVCVKKVIQTKGALMPSDKKEGWGRSFHNWRVKCGRKDVYSDPVKFKCSIFIREHQSEYPSKLKLVPPNAK
jgi:hypothetical protein